MPLLRAAMGSFKFSVDSICVSSVRTDMLVASLLTACFKDSNCTSRFLYSEVPYFFHSAVIRMCFRDGCSTIFGWDFCLWWDQDIPCSQSVFYTWAMYLYYHISVIYIWLYIKRRSIFRLCPKTELRQPDPHSGPSPPACSEGSACSRTCLALLPGPWEHTRAATMTGG